MKSTSAQAKALILQWIQVLESKSGIAINNVAILKLGGHYSSINLENMGHSLHPKKWK